MQYNIELLLLKPYILSLRTTTSTAGTKILQNTHKLIHASQQKKNVLNNNSN